MNKTVLITIAFFTFLSSCNNSSSSGKNGGKDGKALIKEEAVTYSIGDTVFNGYITYDHNQEGKRPAILIVHEWWGVNNYVRNRAKQLADLGYIAMVVDMYGGGQTATDPLEAQKFVAPFFDSPQIIKPRFDAAMAKLLSYKQADNARVAAIGYCFGGYIALNAAKMGAALKGVVSFHGNLGGVQPSKDLLSAKILICHGSSDNFVPQQEVDMFKKGMDSIQANYTIKVYPNATHAFSNPEATEMGKKFKLPVEYNAAADSASWSDMKAFFKTIF